MVGLWSNELEVKESSTLELVAVLFNGVDQRVIDQDIDLNQVSELVVFVHVLDHRFAEFEKVSFFVIGLHGCVRFSGDIGFGTDLQPIFKVIFIHIRFLGISVKRSPLGVGAFGFVRKFLLAGQVAVHFSDGFFFDSSLVVVAEFHCVGRLAKVQSGEFDQLAGGIVGEVLSIAVVLVLLYVLGQASICIGESFPGERKSLVLRGFGLQVALAEGENKGFDQGFVARYPVDFKGLDLDFLGFGREIEFGGGVGFLSQTDQ